MTLKIDFPSIIDAQQELDPELHREVFTKTANEMALRSLNKTNTKVKRKWNLAFEKTKGNYDWVVTSAIDGSKSKRGGTVNFSSASVSSPVVEIEMASEAIPDKRFDFDFAKEIAFLSGNKKKLKTAVNRQKRSARNDIHASKRPRVKILKKDAGATLLHKAFYARFKSKHEGIFRRKGGQIIELRTITIASMYEQVDFNAILADHHSKNMVKRYDHYLLQALKRK